MAEEKQDPRPSLTEWLSGLAEDDRLEFTRWMQAFAHDLRQPLAQIHSAEGLIRRMLQSGDQMKELQELLDIIREANRRAADLVAEFVDAFSEESDEQDRSGPETGLETPGD